MTQSADDLVDGLDLDYVKLVTGVARYLRDIQGRSVSTIVELSRVFISRDPSPQDRSLLVRAHKARDHVTRLVDDLVDHPAITPAVLEELARAYPTLFVRVIKAREKNVGVPE